MLLGRRQVMRLLAAGLLLGGCRGDSQAATTTPAPPSDPARSRRATREALAGDWLVSTPGPGQATVAGQSTITAADLALARDLWRNDPNRQRYRLEIEVAGLPRGDGVTSLEVVDQRVRAATRSDEQPVPAPGRSLTVETLFAIVETSLADIAERRLAQLQVTFDGHSGVPIHIGLIGHDGTRRTYIVRSYSPLIG